MFNYLFHDMSPGSLQSQIPSECLCVGDVCLCPMVFLGDYAWQEMGVHEGGGCLIEELSMPIGVVVGLILSVLTLPFDFWPDVAEMSRNKSSLA